MKQLIKKTINKVGYELTRLNPSKNIKDGYNIYTYLDKAGKFDYEKYKEIQIAGNKRKLDNVWVIEENIQFLAEYLRKLNINPQFGLCHGTRQGKEQAWFRKYLNCDVIGTEISDTAIQFENTIQWDFHDVKDEWIGKVDFIYSNSLDHSHDPEKALDAWMSCLSENGVCIIEHSSGDEKSTELDPFAAPLMNMAYIITLWGKGNYSIKEIFDAPLKDDRLKYMKYFILQKNRRL